MYLRFQIILQNYQKIDNDISYILPYKNMVKIDIRLSVLFIT